MTLQQLRYVIQATQIPDHGMRRQKGTLYFTAESLEQSELEKRSELSCSSAATTEQY